MSTFVFIVLVATYVGVEAWFALRRSEDGPLASAWAWRAVAVLMVAISLDFSWPFGLL